MIASVALACQKINLLLSPKHQIYELPSRMIAQEGSIVRDLNYMLNFFSKKTNATPIKFQCKTLP